MFINKYLYILIYLNITINGNIIQGIINWDKVLLLILTCLNWIIGI